MRQVAVIGSRFYGRCQVCDEYVYGTLMTGEFAEVEGKKICTVGSRGVGDCGHNTYVITGSSFFFVEDKAVARVGDLVAGVIDGEIITGEFILIEQ